MEEIPSAKRDMVLEALKNEASFSLLRAMNSRLDDVYFRSSH